MEIDILSLFPGYFEGPFDESIIKQARKKGLLKISLINIRDFTKDKHHRTDDRPFGGGPGMVMMAEPLKSALSHVKKEHSHVVYLSPQGKLLNAQKCKELSREKHLILICGHYEGIDERVIDTYVDEEISIGDYVLTNGALASIVLVDGVVRFIPGVLGSEEAALKDSFENGLLDHPHYTSPLVFEGMEVPEVLLGGNHSEIEKWRKEKALEKTKRVRYDLYLNHCVANSQSEGKRKVEVTLPVRELSKSRRFYEKILSVDLNLIEGDPQNGVILSFECEREEFEILYSKLKREVDLVVDAKNITFKDLNNYSWLVRLKN